MQSTFNRFIVVAALIVAAAPYSAAAEPSGGAAGGNNALTIGARRTNALPWPEPDDLPGAP